MSKPAFTPAPWTFEKCRCGHPGCTSYTIGHQGTVGFQLADAKLIVAAPDMATEGRALLTALEGFFETSGVRFPADLVGAATRFGNAVAKAEGRA